MSGLHQRAIELERQLAEAQGFQVASVASSGTVWVRKEDGSIHWRPRPAHDMVDCMNLMIEVGVWPRQRGIAGVSTAFEVVDSDGWVCHTEGIAHDDDRKVCFMLAAVAGAIKVLKRRAACKAAS